MPGEKTISNLLSRLRKLLRVIWALLLGSNLFVLFFFMFWIQGDLSTYSTEWAKSYLETLKRFEAQWDDPNTALEEGHLYLIDKTGLILSSPQQVLNGVRLNKTGLFGKIHDLEENQLNLFFSSDLVDGTQRVHFVKRKNDQFMIRALDPQVFFPMISNKRAYLSIVDHGVVWFTDHNQKLGGLHNPWPLYLDEGHFYFSASTPIPQIPQGLLVITQDITFLMSALIISSLFLLGFYFLVSSFIRSIKKDLGELNTQQTMISELFQELGHHTEQKIQEISLDHQLIQETLLEPLRKISPTQLSFNEYKNIFRVVDNFLQNILGLVSIIQEKNEKLRAQDAKLSQTNKLEALGTLAGGIAHDFNNILGGMMGYMDLIQMTYTDENLISRLKKIRGGADRAKDLVRQILTFSRQDVSTKTIHQLQDTIQEILSFCQSSLPRNVRIHFECPTPVPPVLADRTQMYQVLLNLCTNAIYATKSQGGEITISLRTLGDPHTGQFIEVSVADTGSGIPPEIMNKIFDPFFTTKPIQEGTGLGLSVVHGIIQAHNGKIDVSSVMGKGTVFTIQLPAAAPGVIKDSPPPLWTRGHGEKVLFVEDDETFKGAASEILKDLGYQVTSCSTAEEAWTLFTQEGNRFDLVISDHYLPRKKGLDLLRDILALHPQKALLLCSEIKDEEIHRQLKTLGLKDLWLKPILWGPFSHHIAEMLKNRQP